MPVGGVFSVILQVSLCGGRDMHASGPNTEHHFEFLIKVEKDI